MANQPRLEPLEQSEFFSDGKGSRDLVRGVVPRPSRWTPDTNIAEARTSDLSHQAIPSWVQERWERRAMLEHGQRQYDIYCVHCHDSIGTGRGIVAQRGFPEPATYHTPRLRRVKLSYIVGVIEAGHGQMPAHGDIVSTPDRWAIASYVRALQLSQYAPQRVLEAADMQEIERATESAGVSDEPPGTSGEGE